MNFKDISESEQKQIASLMFQPLSSEEEVKDWIMFYLGLEYPNTTCDKESNSNPLNAIWTVYNAFKINDGKVPGAIWLSARECLKTVSVAILEVLLMVHFKIEIAHASAVESQSHVCLRYIEGFLFKIEPLLKISGWANITQNKRTFEFSTPDGRKPFIKVVICTAKGMNSLHANLLVIDELDLADPAALNEGRNIVGFSRDIHGFTLFLSTRKYSVGNMAEAIEKSDEMGYTLLRWNLLDVTQQCSPKIHLPDEPKEDRYVTKNLPLLQLSKAEFDLIPDVEKPKWDLIEQAHAGCKKCLLLPICRKKLSELPDSANGGFYKPIQSVIQKFKENPPDIAEAQLLCWKPGSEGLVYPRFNAEVGRGNVITLKEAFETLHGPTNKTIFSELTILNELQQLGIPIYAGVDWGFTHDAVIMIIAKLPNDEIWILDCFASPGLEFSEILETAKGLRDKYHPQKWFADTAMPSHLLSFNKNGMKCPNFNKDVIGGIEAVRSKIVTAAGHRFLKVLYTENNKKVINAISKHRFIISQGNVTPKPDDEPGIADIADSLRYIGQNLFPVRGPYKPAAVWTEENKPVSSNPTAEQQMREEISKLVMEGPLEISTKKKGGFHFSM